MGKQNVGSRTWQGLQDSGKDNLLKTRSSTARPAGGAPAPVRGTVSSEKPTGLECPQHTVLAREERGAFFFCRRGIADLRNQELIDL